MRLYRRVTRIAPDFSLFASSNGRRTDKTDAYAAFEEDVSAILIRYLKVLEPQCDCAE